MEVNPMTVEHKSGYSPTGHYLSSSQQLQEELNRLKRLAPRGKPDSFHLEFNRLHPEVQKQIHYLVWMASGCPKVHDFGNTLLKKDISILTHNFPSLTGGASGTILQQVEADLRLNFSLSQKPAPATGGWGIGTYWAAKQKATHAAMLVTATQNRVQFFRNQHANIQNSKIQMKAIFNAMHPAIQEKLRDSGFQPPFYGRGFNPSLHKILGAHYNPVSGRTRFRVYAPNAQKIDLRLTAFKHVEHTLPMQKEAGGIWSVETEHAKPHRSYHFMITGQDGGQPVRKTDPFAFQNIIHDRDKASSDHESQISEMDTDFPWTDGAWMAARRNRRNPKKEPLTIYEVYAPGWKKKPSGEFLNWRELAVELARYCRENGYNAVELMAMFSHSHPMSLGYQINSYFAPNCDMGTWRDFQFFVNEMHTHKIRVFADWVPAHFSLEAFALGDFDGTPLLENDNRTYALHPLWGTKSFDFGKQFTRDFLISHADFLLDKLHLDGLRVDAVDSILNLNFGRKPEDYTRGYQKRWNRKGTEIDLDGQSFLRHFNAFVHRKYPGVLTMAEEHSGFPNLTRLPEERGQVTRTHGLGFDYGWHMLFKYDTLEFWKTPAAQRPANFQRLISSVQGVDRGPDILPRESQILACSHDESAHGKGTILAQMAGNSREEKFANGRLALAWQLLRGGGPVLDFMGNETLQSDEWSGRLKCSVENRERGPKTCFNWEELDPATNPGESHFHLGARACRRDLNLLHLRNPGLQDQGEDGIRRVHTDFNNGVLCIHRKGGGQQFICIFNTSDRDFFEYIIPLPNREEAPELDRMSAVREVYNTDARQYGGQGRTGGMIDIIRDQQGRATGLKMRLPSFTAIMLEERFR